MTRWIKDPVKLERHLRRKDKARKRSQAATASKPKHGRAHRVRQ